MNLHPFRLTPVFAVAALAITAPDCRATLMDLVDVGLFTPGGASTTPPCGANPSVTDLPPVPIQGRVMNVISSAIGVGKSSVFASFSCSPPSGFVSITNGNVLVAQAFASSGIGPLGIGVSVYDDLGGAYFKGSLANLFEADAYALAIWSNTVTPLGGTGVGFIQFLPNSGSFLNPGFTSFAFEQNGIPVMPVVSYGCYGGGLGCGLFPIIFGEPYSLDLMAATVGDDFIGSEPSVANLTIESVSLYNGNGQLLPNGSLAVAPEPASILLLVTVIGSVMWLGRSKTKPRRT